LVGLGGKMLRNHTPVPATIPISPFDAKQWYKIKNKASGLKLKTQGKTAKAAIVQAADAAGTDDEWQLSYDGNGYFKIKNRVSGKVLDGSGSAGSTVAQAADGKSADVMWRLEWDGTGACRIINKASGKALSSNGETTAGTPVLLAADAKDSDNLRWQIIEPG
jgi:endo-1,3-1,4-beta-glycanase ExoK